MLDLGFISGQGTEDIFFLTLYHYQHDQGRFLSQSPAAGECCCALKELLSVGCVLWGSDPPKWECPHHFGVTKKSLWGDVALHVLEKDQERHRAHFSVFRGALCTVAAAFLELVCSALLLNLTGICISLERGFNSKFLLLFREALTFSERWLLLLKPGVSAKTSAELCFRTSATSSPALCL